MVVFSDVPVHGWRNGLVKEAGATWGWWGLSGQVKEERTGESSEIFIRYERDVIGVGSVVVDVGIDGIRDEVAFGDVDVAAVLTRIVFCLESSCKVVDPEFRRVMVEVSETVSPKVIQGKRSLYPRA